MTSVKSNKLDFIGITDLAELTFFHPVVDESLYLLGLQAAELIHSEIEKVLGAATNTVNAGGKATAAAIAAGDKMTAADVVGIVRQLRTNSARTFNGYYIGVVSPSVEAALLLDDKFREAAQYSAAERIWQGEIMRFFGVAFVRAEGLTSLAKGAGGASTAVVTDVSFFFGQYAYAVTDLQDLRVYHHAPGSAGTTDPLNQKRSLGWKCAFKACILNDQWIITFKSDGS